jgi:hypothetical protein
VKTVAGQDIPQAVVTIDPNIGETFAPPPAAAQPALTATEAWVQHEQQAGAISVTSIPSGVRVQLGLLTLPVGDAGPHHSMMYTAHNELVYGFSWHSCPMIVGGDQSGGPASLPANPCIEWRFIDAATGEMIDDTWQQ